MPEATPGHVSGFVSILGRPNSGKSTLLNALVGTKLAIVTAKPQTTRALVQGVLTLPNAQVVFLDTPGIHAPDTLLNRRMMDSIRAALDERDLLLFLADARTGDVRSVARAGFHGLAAGGAPSAADDAASATGGEIPWQPTSAGDLQSSAAQAVVNTWSWQDPASAARWVETFDAGDLQVNAWRQVAQSWGQNDPDAAEAWVTALPRGDARDTAIGALCDALWRTDPASAARLAGKIDNADMRTKASTSPTAAGGAMSTRSDVKSMYNVLPSGNGVWQIGGR